MKFELPKIEIERFDCENIIATSSISSAAYSLAEEMKVTATGGVNVVEWDMYSK